MDLTITVNTEEELSLLTNALEIFRKNLPKTSTKSFETEVVALERAGKRPCDWQPTKREAEVLSLLAEGFDLVWIGKKLGISKHTAKFHQKNMYEKLVVCSRVELINRARLLRLVP